MTSQPGNRLTIRGFLQASVTCLLWVSLAAGAAGYPAEPAIGRGLVCLSEMGITCLDENTMNKRWSALHRIHTFEPVIGGNRLLVGSTTGLHALDLSNGRPQWHWHLGDEVFSPAVDADTVYVTDHAGRIAAIDFDSGKVEWQRKFSGWLYTPALIGNRVITGGQAGMVYALDRRTGNTIWARALDQELVFRPIADEDGIVVTTFKGTTAKLSVTGEFLWRKRDPSPSFPPVSVGRDLLVFGGMDGLLRARHRTNGELSWAVELSGQLAIPARAYECHVAVASPDRDIAVIDATKGAVLVRKRIPRAPLGGPIYMDHGVWRTFYLDSGIISWIEASSGVRPLCQSHVE